MVLQFLQNEAERSKGKVTTGPDMAKKIKFYLIVSYKCKIYIGLHLPGESNPHCGLEINPSPDI